jgi:hypothetical protein
MSRYRTRVDLSVEKKPQAVTVVIEAGAPPNNTTHKVTYEYPAGTPRTVPGDAAWKEELASDPVPPAPRVEGKLERTNDSSTGAKIEIISPTKTS